MRMIDKPGDARATRFLIALAALLVFAAVPARAQNPFPFHATHYDIDATLRTAEQTLAAKAIVQLTADAVSRTAILELHADLNVSAVTSLDGKPLGFDRDPANALRLRVSLPQAYAPGQQVAIIVTYAGPVSGLEDSPTRGLRLASIDPHWAYLLLGARWFPLTNFPANRYTAEFRITAPQTFAIVGTGSSGTPDILPGGLVSYKFHCPQPSAAGTFVGGPLQLTPVQAEGISFSVYAPASAPAPAEYANTLGKIMTDFASQFGPLPQASSMTVAEMPDGSVGDYSGPGLLLISARHWTEKINADTLARMAASQWWGSAVMPASADDVWLTDGLSYYSEVMRVRQDQGEEAERKLLQQFAVGALMYENVAAIAQAHQLGYGSPQYTSIVCDKGAMVFHMLRTILGTEPFEKTLRDFYSTYRGKSATLDNFEQIASRHLPSGEQTVMNLNTLAGQAPLNLNSFFSQWVNSTGIPEFKLEYIVYRVAKGFKVVGKVTQDLEAFTMPVEIHVETEGNPVTQVVTISGTTSGFVVDTFGRPKPNGITIDPDNNLLKANARLRVMSAVARGENEAEQGRYYEAIQDYQQALALQSNNSLALFRTGEAMFYQKNYQAAANAFRDALDGDMDASYKWVGVWSHIYLGKVFDLTGQRERAVNEYSRAQHMKDDTDGAQAEAAKYLAKPYTGMQSAAPSSASTHS
jgi:aminopeptidase N